MTLTTETTPIETAAVTSHTGVLLITNNEQTPDDSYGFTVALSVAATSNVPITLYDRSEETWGDSQHPEGPLAAGDERLADRDVLASQIAWLNDHEVTGQGWVSTLPSISAVLTALSQVGADVVIVPDTIQRKLFERALTGDSLAETLAEQIRRNNDVTATVIDVTGSGTATIVSV